MEKIGFTCKSCMYKTEQWCKDPLCQFYSYHKMLQSMLRS